MAAGLCQEPRLRPCHSLQKMWKLPIGGNGKQGQAPIPKNAWFALRIPAGDDAEMLRDEVTEALQMDWIKPGSNGQRGPVP